VEGDLFFVSCGGDTVKGNSEGGVALVGEACCDCIKVTATLSGDIQKSRACFPCYCSGGHDARCNIAVSCDVAHQASSGKCCPNPDPPDFCAGNIYGGPPCACSDCTFLGGSPGVYSCGNIQCVAVTESKKITTDDPYHDKDCGDCNEDGTDATNICDVPCGDDETICTECFCGTWVSGSCNSTGCLKHNIDCPGFSCSCADPFPDDISVNSFQVMGALHKIEEGGENDCFDTAGYWISIWIYLQMVCEPGGFPETTHDFEDGIFFFLGTDDPKGTSHTFTFTDTDLVDGSPDCGLEEVNYSVTVEVT
jgi:hypothetical protein